MSQPAPKAQVRNQVRFALPSSLGPQAEDRAKRVQTYLQSVLNRDTEIVVPESYELLARDLLAGKVDAAWAPPFVCARIEAMGVRVLVRGVRNGASTYRAALVCRKDSNVTMDSLQGTSVAWGDRDSVGGYLLAAAFMREKGMDPAKTFFRQDFLGSYRAALDAVLLGKVDVASVYAPSARAGMGDRTGVAEVWPEKEAELKVVAFTDEAPNDGVAVSMSVTPAVVTDLERVLLAMNQGTEGQSVLGECFHADKFELAPRMGYRALYRVALASL